MDYGAGRHTNLYETTEKLPNTRFSYYTQKINEKL